MSKIVSIARPPVFKISAQIEVWLRDDPQRVSTVILYEEVVTANPNRRDMEAIARSAALARIGKLGVDTLKLDDQLLSVEFYAARSRTYFTGSFEPEPHWIVAIDDLARKDQAIRDMTYLPYDLKEQREVYGA